MRDSSNLLAHEAAFALGQMQDVEAIRALEDVLEDLTLHPIVRHEVLNPFPFHDWARNFYPLGCLVYSLM